MAALTGGRFPPQTGRARSPLRVAGPFCWVTIGRPAGQKFLTGVPYEKRRTLRPAVPKVPKTPWRKVSRLVGARGFEPPAPSSRSHGPLSKTLILLGFFGCRYPTFPTQTPATSLQSSLQPIGQILADSPHRRQGRFFRPWDAFQRAGHFPRGNRRIARCGRGVLMAGRFLSGRR